MGNDYNYDVCLSSSIVFNNDDDYEYLVVCLVRLLIAVIG